MSIMSLLIGQLSGRTLHSSFLLRLSSIYPPRLLKPCLHLNLLFLLLSASVCEAEVIV
jgi:hypothetical protein